MKGKHRKSRNQAAVSQKSRTQPTFAQFQVKFELSNANISCFINANRNNKSNSKRKPQASLKTRSLLLSPSKSNHSLDLKVKPETSLPKNSHSPDIVQESSNSILSKIQERGLSYNWKDTDKDFKDFSDDDYSPTIFSIWGNFTQFNDSLDKSFASTNDHNFWERNYDWQKSQAYVENLPFTEPSRTLCSPNSFVIDPKNFENDWRTTVMIRNIPNKYSISELSDEIDSTHPNIYDFLYLPCDIKNQCNVGYGFINFVSTEYMASFYQKFHNHVWLKYRSQKICALTYARLQGLNELIEHFSNSKVLNQKDKRYRPIIKYDYIQEMVREQQRR